MQNPLHSPLSFKVVLRLSVRILMGPINKIKVYAKFLKILSDPKRVKNETGFKLFC